MKRLCSLVTVAALVCCQAQTAKQSGVEPLIVARIELPGHTASTLDVKDKVMDDFDSISREGNLRNWRGNVGVYDDLSVKMAGSGALGMK